MKRASVVTVDEKMHRVMLGNHEIGSTKLVCDAQLHANLINDALDEAFEEGEQKALETATEIVQEVVDAEKGKRPWTRPRGVVG